MNDENEDRVTTPLANRILDILEEVKSGQQELVVSFEVYKASNDSKIELLRAQSQAEVANLKSDIAELKLARKDEHRAKFDTLNTELAQEKAARKEMWDRIIKATGAVALLALSCLLGWALKH